MKATYNKDYHGRYKAPRSGHRGELIFQDCGNPGKTIIRHMPEHYNDARTEAQQRCRSKHDWVMGMHRLLKEAYKGCFDGLKSDYTQFLHYNMLNQDGRCMVSHGSLPPLNAHIQTDGHLEFELIAKDWKPGDIVRLITVSRTGAGTQEATFTDSVVSLSWQTLLTSLDEKASPRETYSVELPGGSSVERYCLIHLRDTGDARLCSTEYLSKV